MMGRKQALLLLAYMYVCKLCCLCRHPSVRARHSAVWVPSSEMAGDEGSEGTLLVYGGSDEGRCVG